MKGIFLNMYKEMMAAIWSEDPDVAKAMDAELGRLRNNIELIASENTVSPAVMAAAGSVLTNKYAEGLPGRRYYGGCEYVDIVENIAIDRVKKMFSAGYANVQPHSGSQANYAVYLALCKPGDVVLGMDLGNGGHLTHGSPANFSGKTYNIVSYGVNPETGYIDYDNVRDLARKHKPRMIVAGASAYARIIDFEKFGEIAREAGAYLMVDMAHIAGLVAAGEHPNPLPHATVVTSTTHKTLRGPRGGIILTNHEDIAKKINSGVFPGTQGGPLMHIIAAKAVAFGEALRPEFKTYQHQVVRNAKALAQGLCDRGMNLLSGGTDNHLTLLDLRSLNLTGRELEHRLDEVRITANKNMIPNDPQTPANTSGMRLGTPCVTSRGFIEDDMVQVSGLIHRAATDFDSQRESILDEVRCLCEKYPLYENI